MSSDNSGMIVITGADGFVGTALVAHCVATGRSHVAVARESSSDGMKNPWRVHVGDLATTPDPVLDAIVSGAAAVVHLAGRAHVVVETAADPAASYHAANVTAMQRVAGAAVRGGV